MALPADAWGLSRHALDARLATAVERCGGEVWQGASVTHTTQDGDAYRVQVRRSAEPGRMQALSVQARAVIMACGRHSSDALPPRNTAQGADKRGWRNCVGLKIHYQNVHMDAARSSSTCSPAATSGSTQSRVGEPTSAC